jgi:hypothetical protein
MAKKYNSEEVEERLNNFRNRWEEMSPSELIIELKTLEDETFELFNSLREKRVILSELRRYIEDVRDNSENMYDPSQND